MSKNVRIGLDFGGVVVKQGTAQFGEDTADAGWEPQEGALKSIALLGARFAGSVFVVSKAGPRMQARTRAWLGAVGFYGLTGVRPEDVHFCRKRREKLTHCERFSITHFVDDRSDVMEILRHGVPHLFRFAPDEERGSTPDFATHVSSWEELLDELLASTD